MIKVSIVEDIKPIREGLAALINMTPELSCIDSYDSCESMLKQIDKTTPEVILMDINLPGMTGIEGVKKVKNKFPSISIIMLTIRDDSNSIFEALMSGATGYLLKTTPPSQIIEAIKDANDGGSPMNSKIANKVLSLMRISYSRDKLLETVSLSNRETEILKKISDGTGYKNIADELSISIHTVRYHIRNIYEKFHINSQSEAISIAFRKGLI